ncbi:hypothetical protein NE237_031450 [Protea cynaroides]|uniref:EamA domain-containing protein n=1 Tax=Protea cynaroides TaxID=273540 RepID=A0A9Q0L1A2_9MAGN|nr:hypothetical protein NE237_031450 [Protea cynaroides]
MRVSSPLWNAVVFAVMMMVQCSAIGLATLSKAAMSRGMSNFIFIMYSYAFATIFFLPFAFFFHRATLRPITFSLICKMFLNGLFGYLVQIFAYTGINYSSPTLAAAISNLTPAFTFILAVLFRMEKLDWKRPSTRAKSIGTMVSVSGAFIVSLYKGPPIMMDPSSSNSSNRLHVFLLSNWVIGGLFFAADCLLTAIWFTFQAAIVKEYPEEFTLTFFNSFFGTIHAAIGSLIAERDQSAWRLKPDLALITIAYSATIGTGFSIGGITWALHQKGPLFVAMFRPLGIVIAVVMGILFLGDTVYWGSLVGSIIISAGFYAVIWGKAQEEELDKVMHLSARIKEQLSGLDCSCLECDWDAHDTCSISASHERSPLEDFSGCPSPLELASIWGFDICGEKKALQPPAPPLPSTMSPQVNHMVLSSWSSLDMLLSVDPLAYKSESVANTTLQELVVPSDNTLLYQYDPCADVYQQENGRKQK